MELLDHRGKKLEFSTFRYSGGEIAMHSIQDIAEVKVFLFNSDRVMEMLKLLDALENKVTLHIHYLPYAREDRESEEYGGCGLRMMINLLKAYQDKLLRITILDAHNIENVKKWAKRLSFETEIVNYYPDRSFSELLGEEVIFVSPDKGAEERVRNAYEKYRGDKELLSLRKIRVNDRVVHISDTEMETVEGKTVVVVDDICDGGNTFVSLYESLRVYNPKSVNLYVTYGIFRGEADKKLKEIGYERVFGLIDMKGTKQ